MTGGVVAVLGDVGRNFAAGMSGGVAYVHDPESDLDRLANTDMVSVADELEATDRRMLRRLVENHAAYTDSDRAAELLADWSTAVEGFTRVMPDAYAAVVAERSRDDVRESPPAPATEAVAPDGVDGALVSDD
jgi:glutamate synthase (NADPH/NADH) large chain